MVHGRFDWKNYLSISKFSTYFASAHVPNIPTTDDKNYSVLIVQFNTWVSFVKCLL